MIQLIKFHLILFHSRWDQISEKRWNDLSFYGYTGLRPQKLHFQSPDKSSLCVREYFDLSRLSVKINFKEVHSGFPGPSIQCLHLWLWYPLRFDCDIGPRRKFVHVKHGVSPGVDAQISGQNSNEVQYEAGFYLKKRKVTS